MLILVAAACNTGSDTLSATNDASRLQEIQRNLCTKRIKSDLEQVIAPQIPIPGSPSCTVQLAVKADQADYLPEDDITLYALLTLQGGCTLSIQRITNPLEDFYPIVIVDEKGTQLPLTEEGQQVIDWTDNFENASRTVLLSEDASSCTGLTIDKWFDLSAPGSYTVTLTRRNFKTEPSLVPGNEITFRRLP